GEYSTDGTRQPWIKGPRARSWERIRVGRRKTRIVRFTRRYFRSRRFGKRLLRPAGPRPRGYGVRLREWWQAVPPDDQNAGWSDGMRARRSNNSVVVVVFIVIVIGAFLAHRTRQVTGRNSPEAPSQPSSQTAAV